MPLNEKGQKIMSAMQEQYGKERGKEVFYASKNKGTIEGVDAKDASPSGAHGDEAAVPKRRPDLLGTVSGPNGIKPAEVKSRDQDLMASTAAPMTTASTAPSPAPMMDQAEEPSVLGQMRKAVPVPGEKTTDEKVDEKAAIPPMNNLSRAGNPGANTGALNPYTGHQVGDSLHNQNLRNRAFWARKGR